MTRDREDSEQRKYLRITYQENKRPSLQIEDQIFEVKDLTQMGIGFINHDGTELGNQIEGILTFLNGEMLNVEGDVVWEQDKNYVIVFKHPMPAEIIRKQQEQNPAS